METNTIGWNGGLQPEAIDVLTKEGGLIVSPTKVGYIIMTTDVQGLERKFEAKQRNLNKPGVVLCGSLDQLRELAQLNSEVEALYERCWNEDVLLGCILPWSESGKKKLPHNGEESLMMDSRGTSCFVIKFGTPSELIAKDLWENHGRFSFASSANPSGQGNRGLVEGIGERIQSRADLVIAANEYVASIQPHDSVETRYEQGVMVSMVDASGTLVPEQKGQRSVTPAPVVIRKGLDVHKIMTFMADTFNSWDYRHGEYY